MAARKKAVKKVRKGAKRRSRPKDPSGHSTRVPDERREAFLFEFRKTNNLTASAERCGFSRKAVYAWMKEDPAFKDQVDAAKEGINHSLEQTAYEMANEGYLETTTVEGVGDDGEASQLRERRTVRKRSPAMVQFLLERLMPEKYGQKTEVTMTIEEKAAQLQETLRAMDEVEEGESGEA